MSDFKTAFHYENGVNVSSAPFEPSISAVSIVGGIDMALFHFPEKYKINGVIYLEKKDGKLRIDFDITPTEAIPILEEAVRKKYSQIQIG